MTEKEKEVIITKMIELDNGKLAYQPTKVVYRGKDFPAPVFLTTLLAWDYISKTLKENKCK